MYRKIFIIILVIVIGIISYFLVKQSKNVLFSSSQNISTEQPQQKNNSKAIFSNTQHTTQESLVTKESTTSVSTANVRCEDSSKYFVISRDLTDSVGSDILVKYKASPTQTIPCTYSKTDGDFEIKNEWAEYFLAVADHFLILDSGTGPPPRGLIVYDLSSRKEVFTDSYSQPAEVSNSAVTYWSPVDKKPDQTNCPKLTEYTSYGLGAEIEARTILMLSTLNKKELGEYRCSPTQ